MCPQLPKTSEGGRVGPPRSTVGILPNLLPSTRHTTSKDQTCAARPRLPKQERPLPPCCHLPLSRTPLHPLPYPHAQPLAPGHPTPPAPPPPQVSHLAAVFLSGGCFIHPHRGPCSLSGGCSPGCFKRHSISYLRRAVPTRRSRNNPQAGLPLPTASQKHGIPSCPHPRAGYNLESTSKLTCPSRLNPQLRRATPGTGPSRKKRAAQLQRKSNRTGPQLLPGVGAGLGLLAARPALTPLRPPRIVTPRFGQEEEYEGRV